jgi:hypothetical protein
MELKVFKGCVPGKDWGRGNGWEHCGTPVLQPCHALWSTAVVSANGRVSPCFGTFYAGDDMGHIDPAELATSGFRNVWNNERYRLARGFFRARHGDIEERKHVCFDCPNTTLWERWRQHRAAEGTEDDFDMQCGTNDTWNYFWNRRLAGAPRLHAMSTENPTQVLRLPVEP